MSYQPVPDQSQSDQRQSTRDSQPESIRPESTRQSGQSQSGQSKSDSQTRDSRTRGNQTGSDRQDGQARTGTDRYGYMVGYGSLRGTWSGMAQYGTRRHPVRHSVRYTPTMPHRCHYYRHSHTAVLYIFSTRTGMTRPWCYLGLVKHRLCLTYTLLTVFTVWLIK